MTSSHSAFCLYILMFDILKTKHEIFIPDNSYSNKRWFSDSRQEKNTLLCKISWRWISISTGGDLIHFYPVTDWNRFRSIWSRGTIWLTWNILTNRLFVTYAVFPPPETLGSPAALCSAMWPGWELEDTYLMWGSADCIVSTGPGTAEPGNFRDTKCLKQSAGGDGLLLLFTQSPLSFASGHRPEGKKLKKWNWFIYPALIKFYQTPWRQWFGRWRQMLTLMCTSYYFHWFILTPTCLLLLMSRLGKITENLYFRKNIMNL